MRIVIFFSMIFVFGACTPSPSTSKVTLKLPKFDKPYILQAAEPTGSDSADSPWQGSITQPSEINCYAVMIGGVSPFMKRNTCSQKNTDDVIIEFGRYVGGIPAGDQIEIELPADRMRRLVLIGMKSEDGYCKDFHNDGLEKGKLSHPRILYDANHNFASGDHNVKIEISEELSSSIEIDACDVDDITLPTPDDNSPSKFLAINSWDTGLLPGDSSPTLGLSTASAVNTVVMGAPSAESGDGAVFVYQWNGEGWENERLQRPAVLDGDNSEFGFSVDTDGVNIIVGAPNANGGNGTAYVYSYDPLLSSWNSTAPAQLVVGAAGAHVGYSVAISNDVAVVGAPLYQPSTRTIGMAAVYVSSGDWSTATETLLDPDAVASSPATLKNENDTHFGESVAISLSGLKIAVGAPGFELNESYPNSGAAFVYTMNTSKTIVSAEPVIPDTGLPGATLTGAEFGLNLGISGQTLISGNPLHNSDTGLVLVTKINGSNWDVPAVPLSSLALPANGQAGASVAVLGDTIVVGSTEDGGGAQGCGRVEGHFYNTGTGAWAVTGDPFINPYCDPDQPTNPGAGDYFGYAVDINPEFLTIGSPHSNDDIGGAYQGSAFVIPFPDEE